MMLSKSNTDKEGVMESLREGNSCAYKIVYDRYQRQVYFFVYAITKSAYAAEEIVQEVFIKIWMIRESLQPDRSFEAFLFAVVRHLSYNYLRTVTNSRSLKEELRKNLTHFTRYTEDVILLMEYETLLEDILTRIPKQKRHIFMLSKRQGKSNQDITNLLSFSSKTVKNHLWAILQTIRRQLHPYLASV